MQTRPASPFLTIPVVALALGACGEDPVPDFVFGDAGIADAGKPDASGDAALRECEIYDEGTTRSCSCATGSGTQACLGGMYSTCRCAQPDAGAGLGRLCRAGYYQGEFAGKYKPGALGLGLFGSFWEVDVEGRAAGSTPALSFTLSQEMEGAGEFTTFTVHGGCMVGSAASGGSNNPFIARLEGTLDCATGMFNGTITGNYNLVSSGFLFNFSGPLSSQYVLPGDRLEDGVWNVKEPPALTGEPAGGGGGEWSAQWQSEAPPAGEDPCAALGDGGAPDAGARDAGAGDAAP